MRLCLIGKYPPIQGGVSAETLWLARGLATRGHEVRLVTNAAEVDPAFRIELEPRDDEWLEPAFPGGGRVRVHATAPLDRRPSSHIPASNPFVSKLAGLATEVIEAHDCDRVLAYYLEPYAMAGWLAAEWTGRPLVVKHAGSDLDRLMRAPELAAAYKRVLRSAATVVTTKGLMARFLGLGVERGRLAAMPHLPIPGEVFDPALEPIRLEADQGLPTIGIYGKIGRSKGTIDLVKALGRLADEGLDFALLATIGSLQGEWLAPALREAGMESRTRILPFLPPWRVGSFIRACSAVCFLERDFPVAIHGPMVPREVLACGSCLVLSEEIASRQVFGHLFEHGHNVVLADPHDHDGLAASLRALLLDPAEAEAIGERGHRLSREIEPTDEFAADWEAILEGTEREKAAIEAPAAAALIAPALLASAKEHWPDLAEELTDTEEDHDPYAVATAWCERLSTRLATAGEGESKARLAACARYQHLRLSAASDGGRHEPPFPLGSRPRVDAGGGSAEPTLIPVVGGSVQIESFDYDVTTLASAEGASVTAMPAESVTILFQRTPNLSPREFRVDEATCALLAHCDGERNVDELVGEMAAWFGVERKTAEMSVRAAIARLRDADVLELVQPRPGRATAAPTGGRA